MTRAAEVAAALERWRIETEPGADMPSMPSVKAAGDTLAAILREAQPAPVVGDDDAALLAKTQDWLCHNLTVTPDSHYRNVQALLERCSAALADVARLEAKPSRYEDLAAIEQLQVQVDHYRKGMIEARTALATAEEAKAKAVRSVAKRACEATAEWAMEDPSVLSPEWIESGKAGQQMNAIIDGCVAAEEEAIRARAGRNDAG